MSRLTELQSQAELPLWMEPLAARVAELMKADMEANNKELAAVKTQLHELVEVQLLFLESLQTHQSKK